MSDNRNLWITILIIFIIYWGFVPAFWSTMIPRVSAEIASEWNHNEDMPVTIVVTSMHSNFKITHVRFYIDNQQTKLDSVTQPLYAFPIYQQEPVRSWNRLTLNRFTFPRTRRLEVIVPFEQMKKDGLSGKGVIVGKLDIEIDHVGSVHQHSSVALQELSYENTQKIQFEITLK